MSKVRFQQAISLDGYSAGPDQREEEPLGTGGEELHEWMFGLEAWLKAHGKEGGIGGLLDFGTAGQPEGNWGDQTCMIIVLGEKRCTAGGSGPAGGGHASGGPTASTAATPAPTNGATARDTPPPAPPPSVTAQPTDPVATIAEPPRTAAADSSVATADRVVALLGVLVLLTIGVLRRHHRRRPRATSP